MTKFTDIIREMNNPDYSSYAGAGSDLLKGISPDWKDYYSGVSELFGVSPEEMTGYVMGNYEIPESDGLNTFVVRLHILSDVVGKLREYKNEMAPITTIVNDFPGQERFDLLKKDARLTFASMIFSRADDPDYNKVVSDFREIQLNMYAPGFPSDHHSSVINYSFLDKLVEDDSLPDFYETLKEDRENPEGLVARLKGTYNTAYCDDIISKVKEKLPFESFRENTDEMREVYYSVKKYETHKAERKRRIEENFNKFVEKLSDYPTWDDYINSLDFTDEKDYEEWNLLCSLLSHGKKIKGIDFDDFKSAVVFKKLVDSGYLKEPQLVATTLSSARPVLGFYGCDLLQLGLKAAYDFNDTDLNMMLMAAFVGPGGNGKTQNLVVNKYLRNESKDWLDIGTMSITPNQLIIPVSKEMFYENGKLNLELLSRINSTAMLGNLLKEGDDRKDLTEEQLNMAFFPKPSVLKERYDKWVNYAKESITKIKTKEDFFEYFGISSELLDKMKSKGDDYIIPYLSEALSVDIGLVENALKKIKML